MPNQQESIGSAPSRFVRERELDGQTDSITSLAFSPAGDLLASGSEDCSVVVWAPLTGVMKHRILLQSAVTSLAWGPQRQLFIGCLDGTLLVAKNFKEQMDNNSVLTGTKSAITAVAVDSHSGHIAFGVGSELHMAKEIGHGRYATFNIFPSPNVLTNTPRESDARVRAVAISFQDKGSRLTVAYLNHGVVCWNVELSEALWQITPIHSHRLIGHAIVLPDKRIAVSNLCDGTDLYDEGESYPQLRLKNPPSSTNHNVVLQLASVVGNRVVSGSLGGRVPVWETEAGELLQFLEHGGQLVQTVAAADYLTCAIIATATSGAGDNTRVTIWKLSHTGFVTKVYKFIRWYTRAATSTLQPFIHQLFVARVSIVSVLLISVATVALTGLGLKLAQLDDPVESVTHSSKEALSGLGTTIRSLGQGYCTTFRRSALNAVEYVHEILRDGEEKGDKKLNPSPDDASDNLDLDAVNREGELVGSQEITFSQQDVSIIYL